MNPISWLVALPSVYEVMHEKSWHACTVRMQIHAPRARLQQHRPIISFKESSNLGIVLSEDHCGEKSKKIFFASQFVVLRPCHQRRQCLVRGQCGVAGMVWGLHESTLDLGAGCVGSGYQPRSFVAHINRWLDLSSKISLVALFFMHQQPDCFKSIIQNKHCSLVVHALATLLLSKTIIIHLVALLRIYQYHNSSK